MTLGSQCRVRHHSDVARMQLPAADLAKALQLQEQIVQAICAAG